MTYQQAASLVAALNTVTSIMMYGLYWQSIRQWMPSAGRKLCVPLFGISTFGVIVGLWVLATT